MSDQLLRLSAGAESNLLLSTFSVKLGCCIELLLLL
jgi:hypothetical protein